MVTKAEILSIDLLSNTCTVRIPYFETSASRDAVVEAIFSVSPNSCSGYKTGDIVFVAFDDGLAGRPVVLGKLYLGVKTNDRNTGSVNCESLSVGGDASLPLETKLLSGKDEKLARSRYLKYPTIGSIIDKLEEFNIDSENNEDQDELKDLLNKEVKIGDYQGKILYKKYLTWTTLKLEAGDSETKIITIPGTEIDKLVEFSYTVKAMKTHDDFRFYSNDSSSGISLSIKHNGPDAEIYVSSSKNQIGIEINITLVYTKK